MITEAKLRIYRIIAFIFCQVIITICMLVAFFFVLIHLLKYPRWEYVALEGFLTQTLYLVFYYYFGKKKEENKMPKICPKCSREIENTDKFCPGCGFNIDAKDKNLPKIVKLKFQCPFCKKSSQHKFRPTYSKKPIIICKFCNWTWIISLKPRASR